MRQNTDNVMNSGKASLSRFVHAADFIEAQRAIRSADQPRNLLTEDRNFRADVIAPFTL